MKRLLLPIAAALALCGVVAGRAPAAQEERPNAGARKLGFRLACQAWTFRELSAFETLDMLQKLGIRYIEFFPGQRFSKEKPDAKVDHNMSPELIAELKAKLEATRVRPVNYGVVDVGRDEASARKVFDWAKTMGLQTIVSEPAEEMFPTLDKLCQEYGINLAIHDHPKPSHYWNPDTVLKVSEGRSKRIGSCADTGHWYRSGLVPVECMKKLEGRIISFHLKDLTPDKRDTPYGTGVCDFKGILTEAKRQGIRAVFSIEYESTSGAELVSNVEKCRDAFYAAANELAK
jgi:sugar phosphate isomerase/epimerase